jgi:hypothetical protein
MSVLCEIPIHKLHGGYQVSIHYRYIKFYVGGGGEFFEFIE